MPDQLTRAHVLELIATAHRRSVVLELHEADLSRLDLHGVDLAGANLRGQAWRWPT